ncbi:MAG: pyridoxal-phosphate-dependent aminotransferase family protein [Bdellovibrionales bacterium]
MHHRSGEFRELFTELRRRLGLFFQTRQPVVVLTGSGSAAMEAVSASLFREKDPVLVIVNGAYGDQWAQINQSLGLNVEILQCPAGAPVDDEALRNQLSKRSYAAIFLQACETSTGVLNNIQLVRGALGSESKTLLVVDGCSAVGAIDLPVETLGIDVLLTSSQKVLMCPAGLSFVCLSERAWQKCESSRKGLYFNLLEELQAQTQQGMTRHTPANLTLAAVAEVLRRFEEEQNLLKSYRERMAAMGAYCRQIAGIIEGQDFSKSPSPTITVLKVPEGLSSTAIRSRLHSKGVFILGGFGPLAETLIRIGHMGAIRNQDLERFGISLVESVFELKGQSVSKTICDLVKTHLKDMGPDIWTTSKV